MHDRSRRCRCLRMLAQPQSFQSHDAKMLFELPHRVAALKNPIIEPRFYRPGAICCRGVSLQEKASRVSGSKISSRPQNIEFIAQPRFRVRPGEFRGAKFPVDKSAYARGRSCAS